MKNKSNCIVFLFLLTLLTACSQESETLEIKQELTLNTEGPFFEGPNTLQTNWVLTPLTFGENAIESISGFEFGQIAIEIPEIFEQNIDQITLSVVSKNVKMQTIATATKNNIKNGICQMEIAKDAKKLVDFLNDGTITVVADITLNADFEENWVSTLNFIALIKIKK